MGDPHTTPNQSKQFGWVANCNTYWSWHRHRQPFASPIWAGPIKLRGHTSFFCRLGSFWSLHCDFRSRSGPFKRHSLSLALVPVPVCSAPGTALLSNGHVRSGVGSQEAAYKHISTLADGPVKSSLMALCSASCQARKGDDGWLYLYIYNI